MKDRLKMKIGMLFLALFLVGYTEGFPTDDSVLRQELFELEEGEYSPESIDAPVDVVNGPEVPFEGDWRTEGDMEPVDCPEMFCANSCFIPDVDDKGCLRSCNCLKEGQWGDIILTESDLKMLEGNEDGNRAGSRKSQRWNLVKGRTKSNKKVYVIYYTIHKSLRDQDRALTAIKGAIKGFVEKTCILFSPKPEKYSGNYVEFTNGRGCASFLGRQLAGAQQIIVGPRCIRGNVMHEMMHTVGFWHEHMRPDRDQYVKIHFNNISANKYRQFAIKLPEDVDSFGSPYDLGSIMHYSGYAFHKNRKETITDRKTGLPVTAQRNGFSEQDVFQINAMYKCQDL